MACSFRVVAALVPHPSCCMACRHRDSWWYDVRSKPTNAVEQLIHDHLLPCTGDARASIVGAEWWTHTRVAGRNLGHQLHYDTEERVLEDTGDVVHPLLSSVCYLSGGGGAGGGPTVVFDQVVDDEAGTARGWLATPLDRGFLTFPGNRLHGVLPGPPQRQRAEAAEPAVRRRRAGARAAASKQRRVGSTDCKACAWGPDTAGAGAGGGAGTGAGTGACPPHTCAHVPSSTSVTNRLTLMVGFWDTPVGLRGRRPPYSACARLPPNTRRTHWIDTIPLQDVSVCRDSAGGGAAVAEVAVPELGPMWETIPAVVDAQTHAPLAVPTSVDQRFFVRSHADIKVRRCACWSTGGCSAALQRCRY